jgi:hypothetical protein
MFIGYQIGNTGASFSRAPEGSGFREISLRHSLPDLIAVAPAHRVSAKASGAISIPAAKW